jgi:hypothetical protein
MKKLIVVASLGVAACCIVAAAGPAAAVEWGTVCDSANCQVSAQRAAADMGVRLVRVRLPTGGSATYMAAIKAAVAAGDDVELNIEDNCASGMIPDAQWQAQADATIDTVAATGAHIVLVTLGNEPDLETACTASEYLRELTEAVAIAHKRGLKITDGGVSSSGINGLFRHQAPAPRAGLAYAARVSKVASLQAGFKATGVDYLNFHWYEGPANLATVIGWWRDSVGLPVTCNEWGVRALDASLVTQTAQELQALGLPHAIAFVATGQASGGAVSFYDPTGKPNANGAAYAAFRKASN